MTERDQFQAGMRKGGGVDMSFIRNGDDCYVQCEMEAAWRGWQAARREPVAIPKDVLDALRFYAHGHHYTIDDDHQQFDAVSGEPANWMFSEKDGDTTMFEDGGIARAVLAGRSAGFEEPVEPFEGEVFTAPSTAPTAVISDQAAGEREAFETMLREGDFGSNATVRQGEGYKYSTIDDMWNGWKMCSRSTAPTTGSAPFLGESDMSDLMTFHSQAEDHEADGYTVHKETMKRLAELGVVNNRGFGRYATTAFGAWLVETAFEQDPTLPLRTVAEHNERLAFLAASMGGDRK